MLTVTKGHDSIYISLMKDEEAVSKLVTRSPLSYDVSVPGNIKETYLADLTKPQKFASQRPVTNIIEKSDPEGDGIRQDQDTDTKKFTLHVWPAPEYRHDSAATTSPLHKSWPDFLLDDQSFLVETLKQSLPDGLAARGLAHWSPDLGKTRAPSTDRTKRNERLHLVDWTPSKLRHRAELRDARKQQPENNTPEPTVLGVNEKDDGSC